MKLISNFSSLPSVIQQQQAQNVSNASNTVNSYNHGSSNGQQLKQQITLFINNNITNNE